MKKRNISLFNGCIMRASWNNFATKALLMAIGIVGSSMGASAIELPAGTRSDSYVGIDVKDIIKTDDGMITVDMAIDLSKVKMKSNYETVYTPFFALDGDTVRLQPFAVTGKNRRIYNERNNSLLPLTFYKNKLVESTEYRVSAADIRGLRSDYRLTPTGGRNQESDTWAFSVSTPYRDWMETAFFDIDVQTLGCANCVKDVEGVEPYYALAQNDFITRSFFPEFLYVTPVAEAVKMREISARAYIDFPVNRTEIYPDYRRNPEELAKIRATIDSVRNDKDINITSLHISGTASPEGGYQNNVRLASGRTESLKNYVQGLYLFAPGFITTSFEPVDWQGLAEFLQMVVWRNHHASSDANLGAPRDSIRFDQFQNINYDPATIGSILPNAIEILGIVNSDIEPFARNQKIKTTYPDQYAWLLENVYPALRHSDYRIQFEIKTFTDVAEILAVMQESPQKLSLAELFVAANSQEPGSELYTRAFETAVTMYPDDQTANLNAATAAMQRGDMISAQRYMAKVTQETPEADYANAMFLLLQGEEDKALEMLRSLSNSLNPAVAEKAGAAVAGLEDMRRTNATTWRPVQ